jgi:GcrA cell cycle regulator
MFVWNEATTARLRQLGSEEGLSNADIAFKMQHEFGGTVSRNAIIGKRLRLGMTMPKRKAPLKVKPAPKPKAPRVNFKHLPGDQPKPVYNPRNIDVSTEFNCRLIDLENCSCRFPLGDPLSTEFRFCGQPTANLYECRSYCPDHMQLTHVR